MLMEGKINLGVKVNFDKPFYYIGENIKGTVILQTEKAAVIEKIIITMYLSQRWEIYGQTPVINQKRLGHMELEINKVLPLSEIEGTYLIKKGITKFPFCFKIITDLDPCFEYPLKDKYAFLRYILNVSIKSVFFKENDFNFNLKLLSRPNIDNNKKCLNKSDTKNVKKWGIFNLGTTSLIVSIPDNNFKYDDSNFKIIIYIDNSNGKESTKEVKVKLTRLIEFYDKNNKIHFSEEKEISSKKNQINVAPGNNQYLEVILPLKEEDTQRYLYNINNPAPYDLFMSEINFYMPSIFTRIITCRYELSVSLNFNCKVPEGYLPKITFPIYLVHQSPIEYQLEIQKKTLLEQKANKMFDFNFNNIKNEKKEINMIKISNNFDEDAPAPLNRENKIDINLNNLNNNINNIFMSNINKINNDNKSRMYTNEGFNFNNANNINYNVNININNNSVNSLNNNFNNNINNNFKEDEKEDIKNDDDNKNEIKDIKQSNFNLF